MGAGAAAAAALPRVNSKAPTPRPPSPSRSPAGPRQPGSHHQASPSHPPPRRLPQRGEWGARAHTVAARAATCLACTGPRPRCTTPSTRPLTPPPPPCPPQINILRLLIDVAHGMAFLHSRGCVHGDLRAENVLLQSRRPDGQQGCVAKVSDAGLKVRVHRLGVLVVRGLQPGLLLMRHFLPPNSLCWTSPSTACSTASVRRVRARVCSWGGNAGACRGWACACLLPPLCRRSRLCPPSRLLRARAGAPRRVHPGVRCLPVWPLECVRAAPAATACPGHRD